MYVCMHVCNVCMYVYKQSTEERDPSDERVSALYAAQREEPRGSSVAVHNAFLPGATHPPPKGEESFVPIDICPGFGSRASRSRRYREGLSFCTGVRARQR